MLILQLLCLHLLAYSVLEGITNIGYVTVEQSTRATRHNPVSGDGRVSFSLVNTGASNNTAGANALSIDSSSALLTFNFTVDYDSMYNPDDGKLDFLATVTATDASGNATSKQIVVTVLNDGNDDVGYAETATATMVVQLQYRHRNERKLRKRKFVALVKKIFQKISLPRLIFH